MTDAKKVVIIVFAAMTVIGVAIGGISFAVIRANHHTVQALEAGVKSQIDEKREKEEDERKSIAALKSMLEKDASYFDKSISDCFSYIESKKQICRLFSKQS